MKASDPGSHAGSPPGRTSESTPEDFTDAGHSVVVSERLSGTGRTSGVPISQGWVAVYTLREGRIVRRTDYLDKADALEAVGLSE